MCEARTFYHLCGHVYIKTIIQCPVSVNNLLNSPLPDTDINSGSQKIDSSLISQPRSCRLCFSVDEEIHIVPTTCSRCAETGIISDWLALQPESRFEAIRSWKESLRNQKENSELLNSASDRNGTSTSTSSVPSLITDHGSDEHDESELETLPFIPPTIVSTVSSSTNDNSNTNAASNVSNDGDQTVPDKSTCTGGTTKSASLSFDVGDRKVQNDIQQRITMLKQRVEKILKEN